MVVLFFSFCSNMRKPTRKHAKNNIIRGEKTSTLLLVYVCLSKPHTVLNFAFSISGSLVRCPSIQMSDRQTGSFTPSAPVMSKFNFADRLFDLTEAFFFSPMQLWARCYRCFIRKCRTHRNTFTHSWLLFVSITFYTFYHVLWSSGLLRKWGMDSCVYAVLCLPLVVRHKTTTQRHFCRRM